MEPYTFDPVDPFKAPFNLKLSEALDPHPDACLFTLPSASISSFITCAAGGSRLRA